ncbi:MAG: ROK family protein [Nitrosopumilaceae archaeon]
MFKIGIDLGGTKTEGVLLDESLEIVERKRVPTIQDYKKIIETISSLVNDLKSKVSEKTTVGVCTPGILSQKTALIKNSNTQCLIGMPLQKDLERALGQKVLMENDANCFAMAEARLGAAKNYGVVFGVIIGTGVGGGIVINGKIHCGRSNIAGEWGHHIIRPQGNKCYCGKSGCIETYISGPALERRWKELTGKSQHLPTIIENLSDTKAKEWKKEFLENFAIGLANVINILDPDVVVLGGGLSNIPFLYDEGKGLVYKNVFSDLVDTPILKNKLGDSAGVIGASLL